MTILALFSSAGHSYGVFGLSACIDQAWSSPLHWAAKFFGTVNTRLLHDTKAAPKLHLPVLSMGKHDQSCPRERLIIQSPPFWTSCFPKIKCIGVPGVSSEEVFINVRQGLRTTGYHFAGCANKAMLNREHLSHKNWWQHLFPQRGKKGTN